MMTMKITTAATTTTTTTTITITITITTTSDGLTKHSINLQNLTMTTYTFLRE